MRDVYEVTLSYTFLYDIIISSQLFLLRPNADLSWTFFRSRARRDSYGNLVPAEFPLGKSVEEGVPLSIGAGTPQLA